MNKIIDQNGKLSNIILKRITRGHIEGHESIASGSLLQISMRCKSDQASIYTLRASLFTKIFNKDHASLMTLQE